MVFVVYAEVPYEGASECFRGTKKEVIEWIKNGKYGYNANDLSVFIDGPDIFALMQEAGID